MFIGMSLVYCREIPNARDLAMKPRKRFLGIDIRCSSQAQRLDRRQTSPPRLGATFQQILSNNEVMAAYTIVTDQPCLRSGAEPTYSVSHAGQNHLRQSKISCLEKS